MNHQPPGAGPRRRHQLGRDALHLGALTSFTVAQPVLGDLSKSPEFFLLHESGRREIVLFAILLVLAPPAVLALVELAASVAGEKVRQAVHLLLVALLTALFAWQVLRGHGLALRLAPIALGILAAAAYARTAAARLVLTVLSPAPLLFVVLFLFFSPLGRLTLGDGSGAAGPEASPKASVVFLLFDELPEAALETSGHRIDAVQYPSFAALAREATWYRNDTTVHDYTIHAVPALLTGDVPDNHDLPSTVDLPRNLFTLFGRSYELRVFENFELCPARLCPRTSLGRRLAWLLSDGFENVSSTPFGLGRRFAFQLEQHLGLHRREDRVLHFGAFVRALAPGKRPVLVFDHTLLPHASWEYLPSGQKYEHGSNVPGLLRGRWSKDRWLAVQAEGRFLLQLRLVDRLLGDVLAGLRRSGLYDRSLLIVTADHGGSFRPGELRRDASPGNIGEIAPVPLFVKLPRQRTGRIDDSHVRSIDVLPTIAQVAGIELPWKIDGRSLLGEQRRDNLTETIRKQAGGSLTVPASSIFRGRDRAVAARIAVFAEGRRARIFGPGPHSELVGRAASSLRVSAGRLRLQTDQLGMFRNVDPSARIVPTYLRARISGPATARARDIAVAVNGRIAATARSWAGPHGRVFSAELPLLSLRRGRNEVRVFRIVGTAALERIEP